MFAVGIWAGRAASFIPGQLLLAFCRGARRLLLRAPWEQMGRSGKARRLALRGLVLFFPPFVPLPTAACAQTTKAACLAASGGAGVTADSGALGDSGTLCARESPGPRAPRLREGP